MNLISDNSSKAYLPLTNIQFASQNDNELYSSPAYMTTFLGPLVKRRKATITFVSVCPAAWEIIIIIIIIIIATINVHSK